MTNNTYSVLIIDDHPLIVEAYKTAFNFVSEKNKNTHEKYTSQSTLSDHFSYL